MQIFEDGLRLTFHKGMPHFRPKLTAKISVESFGKMPTIPKPKNLGEANMQNNNWRNEKNKTQETKQRDSSEKR